jgi:hypothetical protein
MKVAGGCPMGCGETLILSSEGGHVTCGHLGCPDPTVVDDLLGKLARPDRSKVLVLVVDQKDHTLDAAELPADNYILLTGERMEVTAAQHYLNGTAQLTIKRKAAVPA